MEKKPEIIVRMAIDDALHDLQSILYTKKESALAGESTRALLNQYIDLRESYRLSTSEPIRTIHHLACTGGTLIIKCLSCSSNTHILSEVDPLSSLIRTEDQYCIVQQD